MSETQDRPNVTAPPPDPAQADPMPPNVHAVVLKSPSGNGFIGIMHHAEDEVGSGAGKVRAFAATGLERLQGLFSKVGVAELGLTQAQADAAGADAVGKVANHDVEMTDAKDQREQDAAEIEQLRKELAATQAERDRLQAEIEQLRQELAATQAERDRLQTENDQLKQPKETGHPDPGPAPTPAASPAEGLAAADQRAAQKQGDQGDQTQEVEVKGDNLEVTEPKPSKEA